MNCQPLLEFISQNMRGDGFIDRLLLMCRDIRKGSMIHARAAADELTALGVDLSAQGNCCYYTDN